VELVQLDTIGGSCVELPERGRSVSELRQVFNEVIRFEIEIWNGVDARLRSEFNLPLTHFEPMSVIARRGSCRVYEIASELGITTGGASKLIDRIEADGFCRRRPNPDDRRSSLLELTPAGRKVLQSATKAFDDELERRLGGMSSRTVEQLLSTLTRLRAAGRQIDVIDETA
jgi:MarR family transcriptional regulator, organic hydroperoxide resistance regulator